VRLTDYLPLTVEPYLKSSYKPIRNIYYWASEATAEVDFVFTDGMEIYPAEVKAGGNLRSRSLKVYRDRFNPKLAIRVSLANPRLDDGLLNDLLFALFNLENYL
jgi:predicted AAA+ superfamily ATPase